MQTGSSALGDEHLLKKLAVAIECSSPRVEGSVSPSRKEFGHEVNFCGSSSLVLLFVLWLVKAINMLRLHIFLHMKSMKFS